MAGEQRRTITSHAEEELMPRVFKSSGASDDEVQAMRAALVAADIKFEERPQSVLGGGQAGLWVDDPETVRQAKQLIEVAQEAWVQHVRSDPQSVQVTSIFGANKTLIWCTCIMVLVLHVVLVSELFFGW
jgi:hypothetical protein